MEDNFYKNETIEKKKKFNFKGLIAGLLAGTFIGSIGTLLFTRKDASNEKNKESYSMVDGKNIDSTIIPTEEIITTEETELTESTEVVDEILSDERFEKLVEEFSKPYIENNINVTEEDLEKFVSIVNIDELVEENPELASELFSTQTKEEYLNDAAKIIGMTYMYNHNNYMKDNNTDNFIDVSTAVHDEKQKEKIEKVEEYVDNIAEVTDNKDELNKLVEELLIALSDPQSELSYLDDGVGFGMQVDIALILNSIARNYLNQENRDWLQELTSSEKYVSNIFTEYEGCNTSYTRKLTK